MDAINMNVDLAPQRSDQDTNTRLKPTAGRPSIAVTVGNHMYFVDPNTGLILHSTRKLPRHRVVSKIEVYVGLDTKLPTQARDSEELSEALIPFDAWLNKKYFSAKKALDLLRTCATKNAVCTLSHLAQNLSGRNYWFGRIEDLAKALDTPQRSVERALKDLESMNIVKRKAQGRQWPTRITVHPWYAWRGDLQGRDAAYSDWLGISPAEFGGRTGL
jgi:DNA-binding transcriptional ArsR family regulator